MNRENLLVLFLLGALIFAGWSVVKLVWEVYRWIN